MANFWQNLEIFRKKCEFRAVQSSAWCRSRRELSNAYLLAKFGFDTAENERRHVPLNVTGLPRLRGPRGARRPGGPPSSGSSRVSSPGTKYREPEECIFASLRNFARKYWQNSCRPRQEEKKNIRKGLRRAAAVEKERDDRGRELQAKLSELALTKVQMDDVPLSSSLGANSKFVLFPEKNLSQL